MSSTLDWARQYLGQWRYIYGGSRTDPARYGGTDCSGFTHAAFWLCHDGISIGYTTGGQFASSESELIYHGSGDWNAVPWHLMQPEDIILMSRDTRDFSSGEGSHVGIYNGIPGQVIDCGSTPCPTERNITWYNAISIAVKRVRGIEEEVTEAEMQRIASLAAEKVLNADLNGVLLRDRIIGTDVAANAVASYTDPKDTIKVARETRFYTAAILKVCREIRELCFSIISKLGGNVEEERSKAVAEAQRLDTAWKDETGANLDPVLSEDSYNRA